MDVTALVLAVVGAVLSMVSLAWQAATWRLSGPRVRARMLVGATNGSQYGTVPVTKDWHRSVDGFAEHGMLHRLIGVEVRNVGRAATSVVGYKIALGGGVKIGVTAPPPGTPPLPHRRPSRAEPSRAEPSRAEPSRAEPSRAEPSRKR